MVLLLPGRSESGRNSVHRRGKNRAREIAFRLRRGDLLQALAEAPDELADAIRRHANLFRRAQTCRRPGRGGRSLDRARGRNRRSTPRTHRRREISTDHSAARSHQQQRLAGAFVLSPIPVATSRRVERRAAGGEARARNSVSPGRAWPSWNLISSIAARRATRWIAPGRFRRATRRRSRWKGSWRWRKIIRTPRWTGLTARWRWTARCPAPGLAARWREAQAGQRRSRRAAICRLPPRWSRSADCSAATLARRGANPARTNLPKRISPSRKSWIRPIRRRGFTPRCTGFRRIRSMTAVRDLEHSVELNDNRSVFRSRLQLDRDRAARSADLAAIYDAAGMTEVSDRAASRAVEESYSDFAGHLFLADSLGNQEDPQRFDLRLETARESELLVANLLAPPGGGNLVANPVAAGPPAIFRHAPVWFQFVDRIRQRRRLEPGGHGLWFRRRIQLRARCAICFPERPAPEQ